MKKFFLGFCFLVLGFLSFAQFKADKIKWTADGSSMYEKEKNSITKMKIIAKSVFDFGIDLSNEKPNNKKESK